MPALAVSGVVRTPLRALARAGQTPIPALRHPYLAALAPRALAAGCSIADAVRMNPQPSSAPVAAYLLDESPPKTLDWARVRNLADESGALWIHLDQSDPTSRDWVREESGVEPLVASGLLDENSRPRVTRIGDGLLATVRGINLNPDADPRELISLRIWATRRRVITLRLLRFASVRSVMERVESGTGPRESGALFTAILTALTDRAEPAVNSLDDRLDELEVQTIDRSLPDPERADLLDVRQRVITLLRYLGPQAQAMRGIGKIAPDWMSEQDRLLIGESANRLTRMVEDLEAASTRAVVVQDEIANRLAERLGNRTYALTVIAAIVLPLSLLSGVFGMNVGGMPWLETSAGFWIVCGGMAVIGVVGAWIARTRNWL